MKNNETGEFELVVGNRQLLSGFFIVILLLAVTFAMGYVVGQNSPRSAKAQAETPVSPMTNPEARPQPALALPPVVPPAAANAETASAQEASAQPGTQPARDSAASVPAAAPPPAAAPATAPAAVQEAPPGSYWQVMAVNQPAADAVLKTLRDKGFPALLSPGPNNLVRVLVGPYNDVPTMSKAKTDLENLGLRPVRR